MNEQVVSIVSQAPEDNGGYEDSVLDLRIHSKHRHAPSKGRNQLSVSLSRAMKYLWRRPTPCTPTGYCESKTGGTTSSKGSNTSSSSHGIDDMFYRDLNRCSPDHVGFLRTQRCITAPIVCSETNVDDEFSRTIDQALKLVENEVSTHFDVNNTEISGYHFNHHQVTAGY